MTYEDLITEKELSPSLYEKLLKDGDVNFSNPNLLINGDFKINQRGKMEYIFDTTSTPTVHYSVDRWVTHRLLTDKNKITVLDNGIQLESTVENANVRIRQKLEEDMTKQLLGKTLTFSVKILSDCEKVFLNILDNTNINVTNKTFLNVKSNDVLSFTFKVPINTTRLEVQFGTANPNVCIAEYAKLEIGDKATPFIPRHYAEELALCQRYFEKININSISGVVINEGNLPTSQVSADFKVQKRVVPTIYNSNLVPNGNVMVHLMGESRQLECTMTIPRVTIEGLRFDAISTIEGASTIGRLAVVESIVYADAEIY